MKDPLDPGTVDMAMVWGELLPEAKPPEKKPKSSIRGRENMSDDQKEADPVDGGDGQGAGGTRG